MIVVTGAAGFIGSCLVGALNEEGYRNIIAVDDFTKEGKEKNLEGKAIHQKVDREQFAGWLTAHQEMVEFVFHIGARTDTTEFDVEIFNRLNLHYSQKVWELCTEFQIPMVYASSAATYGMGEYGFKDDEEKIPFLKPLNPYGDSKNDFDKWVLTQKFKPFFWAGLKFFNVYGPNEYHKGRMASVIFHAYHQIKNTGGMKLFKSHNPDYSDGGQMRDFVYVKDVVSVLLFLMESRKQSGIYNLGSGKARAFKDLAANTFKAMDMAENISFIDTPEDIRDKYQYFTEADMGKLIDSGYSKPFYSLEEGITDYVQQYLIPGRYW